MLDADAPSAYSIDINRGENMTLQLHIKNSKGEWFNTDVNHPEQAITIVEALNRLNVDFEYAIDDHFNPEPHPNAKIRQSRAKKTIDNPE